MAVAVSRQQADKIGRAIGTQSDTSALWEEIGLVGKKKWSNVIAQVVTHRFNLGAALFNAVVKVQVKDEVAARFVISRCYFSAYYCSRAFLLHLRRKDFSAHSDLIAQLRKADTNDQLGGLLFWLRQQRNTGDYDIYPLNQPRPEEIHNQVVMLTWAFVESLRRKLKKHGVHGLL